MPIQNLMKMFRQDLAPQVMKSRYLYHRQKQKCNWVHETWIGGEMIREIAALRPEMYRYLMDDGCVDKIVEDTRSVWSMEE